MTESKTHVLKTWPIYFGSMVSGEKAFELRRNDRGFKVGDHLDLREYDPDVGYSGQRFMVRVEYILYGPKWGLEEGFCIMQIKEVK